MVALLRGHPLQGGLDSKAGTPKRIGSTRAEMILEETMMRKRRLSPPFLRSRAALSFGKVFRNKIPVDQVVKESLDIVRAPVLVV